MYSNEHFKISCNEKDKNLFSIEFVVPSPVLCLSIVKSKIIRGATITDGYRTVVFKAFSVETFKESFTGTYQQKAALASSLTTQLKYMIEECSHSFLGYNRENLVVVDGNKFLFLDVSLVCEISEDDDTVTVTAPFERTDFFFSPEMEKVSVLPSSIHFKTAYFSLGLLLLSRKEKEEEGNPLEISPYRGTKLWWLIKRCLVEEPEKRSILFI